MLSGGLIRIACIPGGIPALKVIDFTKIKQDRERVQAPDSAIWELVQWFRIYLQQTTTSQDGHPEDLRKALGVVARYWGHPQGLPTGEQDIEALRHEIEALRLETRYWLVELVLALRRLAILKCPFKELDVIRNGDSEKAWIELVVWCPDRFYVYARKYGKSGRPLKRGELIGLRGDSGIAGWVKVGRLTERMVQRLGWRPLV